VIKKVFNTRQEVVYQNPEMGEAYRRVVGGLAWPSPPEPGQLVVVAESWAKEPDLETRRLRILAEREFPTIAEMHRGCMEMRKSFTVGSWFTDLSARQEVTLFMRQDRESLEPNIYLIGAFFARAAVHLGTYGQMVLELVRSHRKILQFGDDSQLSSYLLSRTPEDMKFLARKFPPLAALGYAVAELLFIEPDRPASRAKAVTTWNPYTMELGG